MRVEKVLSPDECSCEAMIGVSKIEKQLIELENTARLSIEKEAMLVLSNSKEYRISAHAMIDESGRTAYYLELTLYRSYFEDQGNPSPTEMFEKLVSDLISVKYSFENRDGSAIVGRTRIDHSNADAEYKALRFALSFYIKRISNRDEAAGGSGCTH